MEESFPRGKPRKEEDTGAETTAALRPSAFRKASKKRSHEDEQPDFLFGAPKSKHDSSKSKKKRKSDEANLLDSTVAGSSKHSLLPLGGGGVVIRKKGHGGKNKDSHHADSSSANNSEPFIEAMGFSKLAKGTKLLGIVREVQDDFCVISLPNLLTGYVLRQPGSAPLGRAVTVGQVLAVVIVKTVTETLPNNNARRGQPQTKRRIQVSIDPSAVNLLHEEPVPKFPIRGRIRAMEDNGLLVDLGHGRKGFLPFSELDETAYKIVDEDEEIDEEHQKQPSSRPHTLLHVNRILDFMVKKSKKDKKSPSSEIAPLSLPSPDSMARHVVPTDSTPSLQSLSPGWLVKAKVEALARNGLCVTFFGNVFRGSVELSHLGGFWIPTTRQPDGSHDWKALFRAEDATSTIIRSFTARILAVDAATKMVRLTVLTHLMDLLPPSNTLLPPAGTVVEEATVVRLDPGVGALLALPQSNDEDNNDDDKMEIEGQEKDRVTGSLLHAPLSQSKEFQKASKVRAAYVHISKAMDEMEDGKTPESLFAKEFAPSTKHSLRILSTSNLIEGVASGATAPSVIKAHVLTHADLVPGKVYRQVPVCAHLNGGAVLVEFGMGIRGLIPPLHLFDQAGVTSEFRAKMIKAKYAIDSRVDVRVLTSDPSMKRCLLTAKKSLIQAADIVTSFTECDVGQTATGFISNVDDGGLSVTFFNNVYGRVTARSLALELGVDNHRENYKLGDVVQCRIARIKKIRRGGKRKQHYSHESENDDESDDDEDNEHLYYRKLTLSLRVTGGGTAETEGEDDTEKASHKVHLRAGAVLPAKAMKIVSLVKGREKGNGTLVPGHAIVSVKSKYLVDEAECATMLPYVECKLSYDQLLDEYDAEALQSSSSLDALAEKMLKVGEKLNSKGLLLSDPRKSSFEYSTGTGNLTLVSIRPRLVEAAENQPTDEDDRRPLLPHPHAHLYAGAKVLGYVANVNRYHGTFVRFLDRLTGLVPKLKIDLELPLFSTVEATIVSVDTMSRPPKILLSVGASELERVVAKREEKKKQKGKDIKTSDPSNYPFQPGDTVKEAEIEAVDFFSAHLKVLDEAWVDLKVNAFLHCTMAKRDANASKVVSSEVGPDETGRRITKCHPFSAFFVGKKLRNLVVVSVAKSEKEGDEKEVVYHVGFTNDGAETGSSPPTLIKSLDQLPAQSQISGIISGIAKFNGGLWLQISPKMAGFVPGVEVSGDPDILNNLSKHFPLGKSLECTVLDKARWLKNRARARHHHSLKEDRDPSVAFLSLLCKSTADSDHEVSKPVRGDLLVGRIHRSMDTMQPPALMMELRGGFVGRCCITELEEPDDWVNMPLGRGSGEETAVVSGESDMEADGDTHKKSHGHLNELYGSGRYVRCRVLAGIPSRPVVEVSLRLTRIEGDLDDDEAPEVDEMVHAYVVDTNRSGCFVKLGRRIEGRVILKELSDGFLPNPSASFPQGRLVVGKVKSVQPPSKKKKATVVDLDLRESTVLESQLLQFSDIDLMSKHRGTVTRVESYGVFVRLENSKVSGLVHKSECSDKFVKNIFDLYDPGDLVKVLVIKKDPEENKIGFSMKASHFKDDEDSEDESDSDSEAVSDDDSENHDEDMPDVIPAEHDDLHSDDEEFATKLAAKLKADGNGGKKAKKSASSSEGSDGSSDDDDDDDDDDDSDSDESDEEEGAASKPSKKGGVGMDTDVGFDWNASSSLLTKKATTEAESDDEDESEDEDAAQGSSHKSRKKQAQKRREESEIFRRETALADGTADENPETAADFERLLSGSPNASEIWIRYMAFHLSLGDISSARAVAERAFDRIEFRQEREKLNVWCALLTLELKYGDPAILQKTIDSACQQNNPKQVYLRVCEMMEKEVNISSPETIVRADEMFAKMCKKFKSKKKVWLAHLQYLLKSDRNKEAQDLLARALKSLPEYKHVETMSKFAQLEFEFGSSERARTIFDGILAKYAKRLDLVFVYADKEVKHGTVEAARKVFERISSGRSEKTSKGKLSDKQMKSLFKKWFSIESEHGTPETQEHVKNAARSYVDRSTTDK